MGDTTRSAWTIESPHLSIRFGVDSENNLTIESLFAGGQELGTGSSPLLSIGENPANLKFVDATEEGHVLSLVGNLEDSQLNVHKRFEIDHNSSIITVETMVENTGSAQEKVHDLSSIFAALHLDPNWLVQTIGGGKWHEEIPPNGYVLRTRRGRDMNNSFRRGVGEDGRATTDHLPWIHVQHDSGGFISSLEWSGRWHLSGRREEEQVSISFGIEGLERTLASGERMTLPTVILQGHTGSFDEATDTHRAWLTTNWSPAVPENWPWVQYNHWYAYYGDIDADRLMQEAEYAANMGCEVFVIDDGWFRGRIPTSYYLGWGDWVEDRTKFPDGIRAFSDQIRSMGMKFGIWVEPERVDHEGQVATEHQEYIAQRDGVSITRPGNKLEGYHTCLGNPDAQEWTITEITRVVQEYGIDWLKWDYNLGYGLGCNVENHGHQAGDGSYAHTLGLYRVLEDLVENCPDLMIENCASGGHRNDLGMIRRTHTSWASDYTHRAASTRQHQHNAGLTMPLSYGNAWALNERGMTEFRSRYGGAFGVSSHLGTWTPSERDEYAKAVSEYKRLRPLLSAHRRLITGGNHTGWDVVQYISSDEARIAILAFCENPAANEITIKPDLIDRNANYEVERDSQQAKIVFGHDLLDGGIVFDAERSSDLLWLTKA